MPETGEETLAQTTSRRWPEGRFSMAWEAKERLAERPRRMHCCAGKPGAAVIKK